MDLLALAITGMKTVARVLEQAKTNKEQARVLATHIVYTQQGLEKLDSGKTHEAALKDLLLLVDECKTFLVKFTGKGWGGRLLSSTSDKNTFIKLFETLVKLQQALNFGLQVRINAVIVCFSLSRRAGLPVARALSSLLPCLAPLSCLLPFSTPAPLCSLRAGLRAAFLRAPR